MDNYSKLELFNNKTFNSNCNHAAAMIVKIIRAAARFFISQFKEHIKSALLPWWNYKLTVLRKTEMDL